MWSFWNPQPAPTLREALANATRYFESMNNAERAYEPKAENEQPRLPIHSSECKSVIVRSEFDLSCRLCSILHKVIMLRRRTLSNGSSIDEMTTALRLAAVLEDKYQIPKALLNDRLYTSPTQSEAARALRAQKKTRKQQETEEF